MFKRGLWYFMQGRSATTQHKQEQAGKKKAAGLVIPGHPFLLPVDKRKNVCESEKVGNQQDYEYKNGCANNCANSITAGR